MISRKHLQWFLIVLSALTATATNALAADSANYERCKKIKNAVGRDECIMSVAIVSGDVSMIHQMVTESSDITLDQVRVIAGPWHPSWLEWATTHYEPEAYRSIEALLNEGADPNSAASRFAGYHHGHNIWTTMYPIARIFTDPSLTPTYSVAKNILNAFLTHGLRVKTAGTFTEDESGRIISQKSLLSMVFSYCGRNFWKASEVENIMNVLITKGADANWQESGSGQTLLMAMVFFPHEDSCQQVTGDLLDKRMMDLNLADDGGFRAIDWAQTYRSNTLHHPPVRGGAQKMRAMSYQETQYTYRERRNFK
jgi:hypothetical protein